LPAGVERTSEAVFPRRDFVSGAERFGSRGEEAFDASFLLLFLTVFLLTVFAFAATFAP
jgi:hypothetical protein